MYSSLGPDPTILCLQNIFADNGIEQMSEVSYAEGADEEWEAWRVKWAPYFLQHYNQARAQALFHSTVNGIPDLHTDWL